MRFYKRTACAALALILLAAAGAALNRVAEVKPEEPRSKQTAPTVSTAGLTTAQATVSPITQTTAAEPEEEQPRIYGSIPLDVELQAFTFERCEEMNLDYEMVLAIMQRESGFDAAAISDTNDYGIMQINQCNHEWLREELGITDFLDARESITAGTEILGQLAGRYEDAQQILMAYNMGEAGAAELWDAGTMTSKYSRDVMARRAAILEGGTR